VAVYDVEENRERVRLAKVVEGFGVRVQKSAFEVRLTRSQRESFLERVRELNMKTGWLVLYRVDEAAKRHHAGVLPPCVSEGEGACFLD